MRVHVSLRVSCRVRCCGRCHGARAARVVLDVCTPCTSHACDACGAVVRVRVFVCGMPLTCVRAVGVRSVRPQF